MDRPRVNVGGWPLMAGVVHGSAVVRGVEREICWRLTIGTNRSHVLLAIEDMETGHRINIHAADAAVRLEELLMAG